MNLDPRVAIEALRAGVPNRTAIRLMGSDHGAIEDAFEAALQSAWSGGARSGLGIAGGFGTGKSHLLGYLAEVARGQGFVVSRVVVSKETPLGQPASVFAAALGHAALPDRPDDPIAACLADLRGRPQALEQLEEAVSRPGVGFAPIFAACLYLLRRSATPPEMQRRLERFAGGARVSLPAIRQGLRAAGAKALFDIRPVNAADLVLQHIAFAALLFRAAGYAGWCILFDEMELIGRYTPLQRAMAYAWLATWLGLAGARPFPGIVAAYAITDDFATAVIDARLDSEKLPERLRLKGRDADATLALAAIGHVEHTVRERRLLPPSADDIARCHDRLRELYTAAYDWPAPTLPPTARTASRTMRQYIKAWIAAWDMQRLHGAAVDVVAGTIASTYAEDAALDAAAEESGADGDEPG